MDDHTALAERAGAEYGTVVLIGGLDTGKTTLSISMIRAALGAGKRAAYVDADLGQKTVGPPTTIGLKLVTSEDDLDRERLAQADACYFVGATSPQGNLLPVVTGVARLLTLARESLGADFVVVDTSGFVSGVYGQLLKYHKLELVRPDLVVGLQRGEELDPLLGIIRRFFATEVVALGVHPAVAPTSVEQRAANREDAMRRYFGESRLPGALRGRGNPPADLPGGRRAQGASAGLGSGGRGVPREAGGPPEPVRDRLIEISGRPARYRVDRPR